MTLPSFPRRPAYVLLVTSLWLEVCLPSLAKPVAASSSAEHPTQQRRSHHLHLIPEERNIINVNRQDDSLLQQTDETSKEPEKQSIV